VQLTIELDERVLSKIPRADYLAIFAKKTVEDILLNHRCDGFVKDTDVHDCLLSCPEKHSGNGYGRPPRKEPVPSVFDTPDNYGMKKKPTPAPAAKPCKHAFQKPFLYQVYRRTCAKCGHTEDVDE